MAERTGGAPWRLQPRTAPLTRSCVASTVLALVGLYAGGVVGWSAAVFFGAGALVLGAQRSRVGTRAVLSPQGVTVGGDPERDHTVPWPDVGALLLWTREPTGQSRHDALAVLTREELPILSDTNQAPAATAEQSAPPGPAPRLSVPLSGCIVDAEELRQVVARHGSSAPVVDRRH